MSARLICALACLFALAPVPAGAITLGQVDDFDNGGAAAWQRGTNSTNPPANMPSGGPDGPDDGYLHSISTGTGTADSRMVMFNLVQWAGDYEAAGVGAIRMMVNNLGDSHLHLRVAFEGGAGDTQFVSTEAEVVPPGSGWIQIAFGLSDGELSKVVGANTLQEVLSDVSEVRLMSATGGLSWLGDKVAGILGVDDIEAIAVAVPTDTSSVSTIKAAWD